MKVIATIAAKEFIDGFRHRWLVFASLIFALLSLAVTFLGPAIGGSFALPQLPTTISALATLAAFIIPLIAILLGHDAFVGEQEGGTLLLLLSYPISRWQLLLGKALGQGAILTATVVIGFGITMIALIGLQVAGVVELLAAFAVFMLAASLLAWAFLLLSYCVSLLVSSKGRALVVSALLWFVLVLLYDMVLLSLIVAEAKGGIIRGLILFNPVDLFRLVNLLFVGDVSVSGVLSLITNNSISVPLMWASFGLWIAALLGIGHWLFKRKAI